MIIAGTGHRPDRLGGYGVGVHNNLVELAEGWLSTRESTFIKPDKVISGMALGWDQALAIAAIRLNIPVVAAIPFAGQESRWSDAQKDRYQRILAKCEEVVYVCEPGYAAWKMQKRNEWMVDRADLILALWNGGSGGTANCIRYAEAQNKPIVNLWDRWLEVRE